MSDRLPYVWIEENGEIQISWTLPKILISFYKSYHIEGLEANHAKGVSFIKHRIVIKEWNFGTVFKNVESPRNI